MIIGGDHGDGRRTIRIVGATPQQLRAVIVQDTFGTRPGCMVEPEVAHDATSAILVTGLREGIDIFDALPLLRQYFIDVIAGEASDYCGSTTAPVSVASAAERDWLRAIVCYVLEHTSLPLPSQQLDDRKIAMLRGISDYLQRQSCLSVASRQRLVALQACIPSQL